MPSWVGQRVGIVALSVNCSFLHHFYSTREGIEFAARVDGPHS
jgi:hypothetical protein